MDMEVRKIVPWSKGIVFRSLAAVAMITLLLGGISSVIIHKQVIARGHEEALQHLGELLDTVESTASVATFANDEQLASEVAQGLLRNSEVQRVVISVGDTELARAERSPRQDSRQPPVKRSLPSPFKKGETIGSIRLEADWAAISDRVSVNSRQAMLTLLGQLLLVIAGTAGMVFLVVVRPIKATSDRLHRLDPTNAGALEIPDGHAGTEIGRLVGDINELTGRLVDTLNHERELRGLQEIGKRKYQDLFDHASSGIFVTDMQGCLASYNRAFVELTRLVHLPAEQPRKLTEPGWSERKQLLDLLRRSADQQVSCEDDFLLCGRQGDERWLHVAIMPLGDGSMQGTVTDITARKRAELLTRRLVITDSLTGFSNREGLIERYASLSEVKDAPFAVVMIDLDGFKQINDAKGFPIGDLVLTEVSRRIRSATHPTDFLSRIGGDEFILVLNGISERNAAATRVDAVYASLCEPYVLNRDSVSIDASIGVAFFPQDGVNMSQLLRSAELALNSVRESTRSTSLPAYRFFAPQLQTAVEHRRHIEDDLRRAVRGGELQLAFQPIVDLQTGVLCGAEVLSRWPHTLRGLISPEVFIPLAERVGLISEIGRQVLEEACRQLAKWRRDGLNMYISVNVSVCQIPDELSPDAILEVLQRHALPAEAMVIEITEGVLMGDIDAAQRWIEQLRTAGVRIYLDDFGTGYSSLSYLKRFPMDTVKIDKSFIVDMKAENSDHTLVNTIITMAGSLGLNVVAEGIENASQLALLRDMGCGYGQGFFFSHPVAAADFVSTAARINAALASAVSSA